MRDAWNLAIEALCRIEQKGLSERLALLKASKQLNIKAPNVMRLAHRLVLETIRRQNLLDHMTNLILKPSSVSDLHPKLRAFLRLYTYETKFRQGDNYEKAANIAKIGRSILGWWRLKPIEEALGRVLNVKPKEALKGLSDEEKTALQFFQQPWFVEYCFKLLGRHEAIQYFKSTLKSTPTYIRLNTLKTAEEEALKKISSEGTVLEKAEGLKHTYKVVTKKQPLVRSPNFKEGLFFIQDKASCLAAEVAAPQAGMTVLDVCSAPGAKTTHLAELMDNQGAIYSIDYSKRRMGVWQREIERMGVKIAVSLVADGYNPLPIHGVEADVVVLDPPCTSTGAFGRMPSAKWRLSKRSIRHIVTVQWNMLNNSVEFVKEGGSLVYSTCSITVEENEVLVERFLKWHPEFRLVDAKPRVGISGLRGQTLSQRLYPHFHECNGFFIAKLQRET